MDEVIFFLKELAAELREMAEGVRAVLEGMSKENTK